MAKHKLDGSRFLDELELAVLAYQRKGMYEAASAMLSVKIAFRNSLEKIDDC